MSIFDFPSPDTPPDQLMAELQRVREYVRIAPDPNEAGSNGRTVLLLALGVLLEDERELVVKKLLERGADPNKPTPWANFMALLNSDSFSLVKSFIDCGLRLNEVYNISYAQGGLTDGPTSMLDHLYAIRERISPKRKALNALANKHVGGLGKRRKFIDETIALLENNGAKQSSAIMTG